MNIFSDTWTDVEIHEQIKNYMNRYSNTWTDGDIRTKIEVQEKHKKRNRDRQIIKTGTNRDSGTA